jgi:mannosyltransferase OCH1-like enzyme
MSHLSAIPKIIHQTARTRDISREWSCFQAKVLALHPGWEYRFWTDDDNWRFVHREFPEFFSVYVALPKSICRADVIRYLIMYKIGGLYLDLDYEMLKPFDLLHHTLVLPYSRQRDAGDDCNLLGNSFFASVPGHPFWKSLIDSVAADPPQGDDIDVESATGPRFVTRIYGAQQSTASGIITPHRQLFHPPIPRSARQYRTMVRCGESYGIHHCHGTWRSREPLKQFLHWVKWRMRFRISAKHGSSKPARQVESGVQERMPSDSRVCPTPVV